MCNLIQSLTIKEQITLKDMINGVCQEVTAMMQGISVRQVKARRANIRQKLGVRTNHELLLKIFDENGNKQAALNNHIQQSLFCELTAANDDTYDRSA